MDELCCLEPSCEANGCLASQIPVILWNLKTPRTYFILWLLQRTKPQM